MLKMSTKIVKIAFVIQVEFMKIVPLTVSLVIPCHAGSMNKTDKKHSKHLKNSVKCNTLDISITINYH